MDGWADRRKMGRAALTCGPLPDLSQGDGKGTVRVAACAGRARKGRENSINLDTCAQVVAAGG